MDPQRPNEEHIRKIADGIYALMDGDLPPLYEPLGWIKGIVEGAMRNETFRAALLRYMDVVPALRKDDLVAGLFLEYFRELCDMPAFVRCAVRRLARKGSTDAASARVIRAAVDALAGIFIAGRGVEDGPGRADFLRHGGFGVSFDLLGEEVLSSREAREYVERYRELLGALAPYAAEWPDEPLLDSDQMGAIPRIDLSVKVSSVYSQLDPVDWEGSMEEAKKGLLPLVNAAEEAGASVTFDVEHYYTKGITFAIFRAIMEEHGERLFGGVALQCYLRDSKEELLSLLDWAKSRQRRVTVRLVKGAYWDYETAVNRRMGWPVPVFLTKQETDRQYEELTDILLRNIQYLRPAFATHNVRNIAFAIASADSLGLPAGAYEFQMIHGMAGPIARAVRDRGGRVRIYTPLGRLMPGMGYLTRRLIENSFGQSFLRRTFFEKRSPDLLYGPLPARKDESARTGAFRNEAATDFSIASNRAGMRAALGNVRAAFGRKYFLVIGGEEIEKSQEIISLNPACPDEVVGSVSSADRQDADRAVTEAAKAWKEWRWTAPSDRAGYLFRAAGIIRKERYELMALEVYEVGKTWKEADGDICEAIDHLEYYGREMIRLGASIRPGDYPGEANEYGYEPKGVAVVISPWNFPLAIPAGMVSAALVTGNTVIFKPSGLSPVIGRRLADIFRRAGLPPAVLQFLPGPGGEVGEYLASHPGVDLIVFTGSKDVGLRIVRLAADTHPDQRSVKRVVAEMGGKNAIIVDETADLDEAVSGILQSALSYQGQKCSACSRVIVIGDIYEQLCDRLKEAMESVVMGPTDDPRNSLGPLIDAAARERVLSYIEIGNKTGKVLVRGRKGPGPNFVGPALFTDLPPDSPLCREEIFGPVLVIMRAVDIGEALHLANDVPYALTGGIFSRSPSVIAEVKRRLRAGNIYVNRKITGAIVGRQPFGGYGLSGVGSKAGGPDYLLQFMNPRSICENTLRRGFAPPQKR